VIETLLLPEGQRHEVNFRVQRRWRKV
jgi:hypothetical protein